MDYIWLIPLLPGLGAALNGVVGIRFFGKRLSAFVACATMGLALALSVAAFWQLLRLPPEARIHEVRVADWVPAIPLATDGGGIGAFEAPWSVRLDPLSAMMILVVTGIGFLIHVYSTSYMEEESPGSYARFFSYLNLFCFFMLVLVLASNYLVMFVGWEGVGLCSYLLIGYWYEKKSAADAGKKAFIVNRIGDWGFMLGMFLVFFTFGTIDFRAVAAAAGTMPIEEGQFGILSLITLLLFVGAVGKSAQIPLHVWLPDAMEGPTPVSALIHAATMVTAGVYMVGRNAVLYSHAPMVLEIVAVTGAVTAILAASIGLVQNDIKRVLAYSTVSQLGFMFMGMGTKAFAAGAFHLMTHAFFKALLFLGSGAVIHGMAGEQDMRRMGGLRRYMPATSAVMIVGMLAIAGIPPFSGFFSKDEILLQAFLHNRLVWGLGVVGAFMTAFYMLRLVAMTFLGGYRGPAFHPAPAAGAHGAPAHGSRGATAGDGSHGHGGHSHGAWHGPHEAPRSMTGPLKVLAVGAFVAGFVGLPESLGVPNAIHHFLEPSFTAPGVGAAAGEETGEAAARAVEAGGAAAEGARAISAVEEFGLMLLSVLVAGAALMLAYHLYVRRPEAAERLAARWTGAHRWLTNKYYVDELYDATFVRGTVGSAKGLWRFDARVVDGAVNGSGWLTVFSSWISHFFDTYVVDALVNLVGWVIGESSYVLRRLQTGLIQNYALVMLFGVFAFVGIYLFAR